MAKVPTDIKLVEPGVKFAQVVVYTDLTRTQVARTFRITKEEHDDIITGKQQRPNDCTPEEWDALEPGQCGLAEMLGFEFDDGEAIEGEDGGMMYVEKREVVDGIYKDVGRVIYASEEWSKVDDVILVDEEKVPPGVEIGEIGEVTLPGNP